MTKKIIVVFGATGKTGGGTINYILNDGTFAARGVTRNPDGEKAKALAARGVEVVKADLNDTQSLTKAMEGAYGVLGMTDFWEVFHEEEKQGKNLVDAAKAAGIKHFVWITLPHSELKVPHWETKANVDDYLQASGIPRTSIYTAYFNENFGSPFFAFKRNSAGEVIMDVAYKTDGPLACMSAFDIGGFALIALKEPEEWIGKDMKLTVEWVTPRQVAKWVEESTGQKVGIVEVDDEKWSTMKDGNEELWLNMTWFYTHPKDHDVELTNKLLPNASKVKDFIFSQGKNIIQS